MFNNLRRRGAIAAALLCSPAAVLAAQIEEAQSVQVHFDDLNLSSHSGRAALNARLAQAANEACQKPAAARDLAARSQFQECRKQALSSAEAQIQRTLGTSVVARNDL